MTYIELINSFWFLDEDWQFTCCETRLYFYLLKTANRLGWVDSWTRSDAKVSSDVGVSVNSMKTARNRLVQAGLINFKAGGKGQKDKTRYQILTPKLIPNLEPKLIPNLEPKPQPNNKTKNKNNNSGELFPPTPTREEKPKASRAKKPEQIMPTLEQVKEYFKGKMPDWEAQAEKFFWYFDCLGWKNASWTKIERWDSRANLWIFEERTKNGNKPTESDAGGTVSGTAGKTGSEESGNPFDLPAEELEDFINSIPIGQ